MFKPLNELILKNNHSPYSKLVLDFFLMLAVTLAINPILEPSVSHIENLKFGLFMASGFAIGLFFYSKIKAKIAK